VNQELELERPEPRCGFTASGISAPAWGRKCTHFSSEKAHACGKGDKASYQMSFQS